MPATRPTDLRHSALLTGLPGLAVALGVLVLSACSPAVDDATPRLLTPQELRAGIEDARTARPTAAGEIEGRAAALRGRAAALRRQPATPVDETDALRRRAAALGAPPP